jgi:hypothetical protein
MDYNNPLISRLGSLTAGKISNNLEEQLSRFNPIRRSSKQVPTLEGPATMPLFEDLHAYNTISMPWDLSYKHKHSTASH